MADEDPRKDGPSLELPSLGSGRRRRKKDAGRASEPVPPSTEPAARPTEPVGRPTPDPTTTLRAEDLPSAPPLFTDEVEPAHEEPAPEPGRRAEPRRRLPAIGGMAASVLTGVLVGALTVGLTWASLHLCEVTRGTSSCGGPGFLLLVAIMVAMVLLGSVLLRALGVPEPGSTSFLSVGLLAVLALLFLVDVLATWWMILVIPVLSALTFALSHWVTTSFIEPTDH